MKICQVLKKTRRSWTVGKVALEVN